MKSSAWLSLLFLVACNGGDDSASGDTSPADTSPADDTAPADSDDTGATETGDTGVTETGDTGATETGDSGLTETGDSGEATVALVTVDGHLGWADSTYPASCLGYKSAVAPYIFTGTDGTYWIDPEGTGRITAYCDMTSDGGGWTLAAELVPSLDAELNLCRDAAVGTLSNTPFDTAAPAKLSYEVINAIWAAGTTREVRHVADLDSSDTTRTAWETACVLDFPDDRMWQSGHSPHGAVGVTMTCDGEAATTLVAESDTQLCGYAFNGAFASNDDAFGTYTIFSAEATLRGGNCGNASAGRTWSGSAANSGCNTGKVFLR